ncbi:hypothetical protein, partial [Streptomyces sp. NPDC057398]|uniref:hypothetical protein n=1 Tax=Streptomyces sp. NPDC057398 TaxID=3346118 RepID=UPI00367701B4
MAEPDAGPLAEEPLIRAATDLAGRAKAALPAAAYAFYAAGSDEEISAREAEAAWRGRRLLPRDLRDD